MNGVLFQAFEWENPSGEHYNDLIKKIPDFVKGGITALWLPPQCKATSPFDVGYGIYDLYDLGEFDQKGEVRTKYGTKDQYLALIHALEENGIAAYADVVINHKASADEKETFKVVKVNPDNRMENLSDAYEIEGWTKFTFGPRQGKYSDFTWHWYHFTGVDYDAKNEESGIFRVVGDNKGWAFGVSGEKGNFDYLMFADIDHYHPEVREELFKWALWMIDETGVKGFRMDAAKHIDEDFMRDFVAYVKAERGEDFYILGEYWQTDENVLDHYLYETKYDMDLFDVKLHYNFYAASKSGSDYDMRGIFDNTIVQEHPQMAVTFVNNHDSQPGQALENFVESWFIPHAYALTLLRRDGYPCVFYGDYYGIGGEHPVDGHKDCIDKLLQIRKHLAYGNQEDHLISEHVLAWKRTGDEEHPHPLVVLVNNGDAQTATIFVGKDYTGQEFFDYTGKQTDNIIIDEEGNGQFTVGPGSISCWAPGGVPLE